MMKKNGRHYSYLTEISKRGQTKKNQRTGMNKKGPIYTYNCRYKYIYKRREIGVRV